MPHDTAAPHRIAAPLLTAAALLSAPARAEDAATPTIGGAVEVYSQAHLGGAPVTAARGFDSRPGTITLSMAALDLRWGEGLAARPAAGPAAPIGRLTLQAGATPAAYTAAEPALPGAGGAPSTDAALWRALQQAYGGVQTGRASLSAGLYLSPIGPEAMLVKDNWAWSRSNLFYGLPFYHTGARASLALSPQWEGVLWLTNGWNSVVDNNDTPSVSAQAVRSAEGSSLSVLYFGGVERAEGGPEGQPWRHLLDAHLTQQLSPRLTVLIHGDVGGEQGELGWSTWAAAALAARVEAHAKLVVAGRADLFTEQPAARGQQSAAPIFWSAPWVSSGTLTLDHRPVPSLSVRLEGRHDRAGGPMFYDDQATAAAPGAPAAEQQTTLTLGLTAWR
ncbi:MAG: outer membrane beta-barrel protein [Deltaproteobacteria bacterium]|nr:outer membrane beta-barrel protein [Deltaproteobacteria bacterium]